MVFTKTFDHFFCTKTFDHNVGLSCTYRQHRADSHCNRLHGYALKIEIQFAGSLDKNNWVIDFGNMKLLKSKLKDIFDHKTLVASDDPEIEWFKEADQKQIIDLVIVDNVGCEMFSKMIFELTKQWLIDTGKDKRVGINLVAVSEHSGNSASYFEDKRIRRI